MTRFYIRPSKLDMWLHQNRAENTGSCVECRLLDNFTVITKRGVAAIYEHYLNEWTSNYYVEFEPIKGCSGLVMKNWYEFESRYAEDDED